jgi:internalin A
MKRYLAAILELVCVVGVSQGGEKEIVKRLKEAGVRVNQDEMYGEQDILIFDFTQRHSDADLGEICEVRRLRALRLWGTNIRKGGLQTIGKLTGLKCLLLDDVKITDLGLDELKGLRNLKCLSLSRTLITDAGLSKLTGFEDLSELYLAQTDITDVGMRTIGKIKTLECLSLANTRITDVGLRDMEGLSSLRDLTLCNCKGITDASIDNLASLKGLRLIELNDTSLTRQGAEKLRKLLPQCRVFY